MNEIKFQSFQLIFLYSCFPENIFQEFTFQDKGFHVRLMNVSDDFQKFDLYKKFLKK